MLTSLAVPYADTAATDLSFALDHPVLPALAVLDVPSSAGLPGLQLRLLGASHQAVLVAPEGTLVETLACLPGESGRPLPTRYDAEIAGLSYRFTLEIQRYADGAEFTREVAAVRDLVGSARHGLTGVFPGADDAVTALVAEPAVDWPAGPSGFAERAAGPAERAAGSAGPAAGPAGRLAWTTWHAYPETGDIVRTRSKVRPSPLRPGGERP
ncbi:DUF2617 family protein [Myceligenerans crystallogenes]|uniref:DUF2617 family protein n=1 Tax=Myceligenerans crystallogenes TaxID=316335 RepID=A0ABN2NJF0_9MICO